MMKKMDEIDKALRSLAKGNGEYAEFNKRIAKTGKEVLGVRMPDMRRLAKSAAKNPPGGGFGAKEVREILEAADKGIYEHVLFAGLLINYAKLSDRERIRLARAYLKHADSWALIDLFAERMKGFDRELWRGFLVRCLASRAEFTVRYGVIVFMSNYLGEGPLDGVFEDLREIRHDGYYVKMGLAWLYAEAAVGHYGRTLNELARAGMDPWTRRKAYQKMLESFRFTPGQKDEIRALRAGMGRQV
jgi:3-methyladenine DNA glycosylase AlkD